MKTINMCGECEHLKVCAYREQFKNYIESIQDPMEIGDIHFNANITCSAFRQNVQTAKRIGSLSSLN